MQGENNQYFLLKPYFLNTIIYNNYGKNNYFIIIKSVFIRKHIRIFFSRIEGYLFCVDVFMHLLSVHFIIVNKKVMLLHDYFECSVSATRRRYIGDSGKVTYCKLS